MSRSHDPYAPKTDDTLTGSQSTGETFPVPPPERDEVPEKAEDVVAWVGDDRDRALLALGVESERKNPRKTVQALAGRFDVS